MTGSYTRTAAHYTLHIVYRRQRHEILYSLGAHDATAFERSSFGQFQFHTEIALVLGGEEAGRDDAMQQQDGDEHYAERAQHTALLAQDALDERYIFIGTHAQPFIDAAEHDVLALVGIFFLQNERAHHRAERKCHNSRNQYRHHDGDGKLTVKLAGDGGQETDGHKHGRQYQ